MVNDNLIAEFIEATGSDSFAIDPEEYTKWLEEELLKTRYQSYLGFSFWGPEYRKWGGGYTSPPLLGLPNGGGLYPPPPRPNPGAIKGINSGMAEGNYRRTKCLAPYWHFAPPPTPPPHPHPPPPGGVFLGGGGGKPKKHSHKKKKSPKFFARFSLDFFLRGFNIFQNPGFFSRGSFVDGGGFNIICPVTQ